MNRNQARISLAYFFAPNLEAEVVACPELIKADKGEHYKHYTLKEYLAVKRGQLLNTLDHFALQPLLRTLALPLRSPPRIPVATRFAWPTRLHPQIRHGEKKRITSIVSLATNRHAKAIKMDCMRGFIVENWNPKNYGTPLNSEKFHISLDPQAQWLRLLHHTDARRVIFSSVFKEVSAFGTSRG